VFGLDRDVPDSRRIELTVQHDERRTDRQLTANVSRPPDFSASVANRLSPLLAQLFAGGAPVRFVFWDGSALGPENGSGTVILHSRRALTRLVWSPDELGFARGFVTGDTEVEGDLYAALEALHTAMRHTRRLSARTLGSGVWAALRLGAISRPPVRPDEEVRLTGWRHSKERDATAINHHYGVSNDFYRLVLGQAMTYSCARFEREAITLEEAQRSKHDLICRKLGLHEHQGTRLLDVGCGWGSLAMHAAAQYRAEVVAITLSPAQAELARDRVRDAGLERHVEIRLQDYRELHGETFDAISSVGMFEHVGMRRMGEYFETLHSVLAPKGRLLNHAISTSGGSKMHGRTFMNRYVFPDGELVDVADVVRSMEQAGFEVRDVESLREHYSATLRAWVANLERAWGDAVELVGEPRARVWRLYMAASANGFEDGGLAIHQVLGVVATNDGVSGMPINRASWDARSIDDPTQRILRAQHRVAKPRP
jgi:cyclopropane-fatty-acyl-phospholipid synthase